MSKIIIDTVPEKIVVTGDAASVRAIVLFDLMRRIKAEYYAYHQGFNDDTLYAYQCIITDKDLEVSFAGMSWDEINNFTRTKLGWEYGQGGGTHVIKEIE